MSRARSGGLLGGGLVAVLLAIGAALLMGGSAAGQAAPGADATIASTRFVLGPGDAGSAAAACPAGSRVVGGGVNTTGPAEIGGVPLSYVIQLSGPLDETGLTANTEDGDVARYWYAYVTNVSGGARDFRVFALCSRTSDATIEAESFTLPLGQAGSAAAACPAGTRVVGGGLGTTGPASGQVGFAYLLQLSGPLDETGLTANTEDGDVARYWYGYVRNATGADQTFKTLALCSASSDATLEVEPFSLLSDFSGAATAACPPGRRVLGGGVNTTGPAPLGVPLSYVIELSGPQDETGLTANTEDGDVARYWYAYVRNVSGAAQNFKVIALCSREGSAGGGGGGTGPGGAPGRGGGGIGGTTTSCGGVAATIRGTARAERIRGSARRDVIAAGAGADRVAGLGGDDLICGGPGDDTLSGGAGRDRLLGQAGRDLLKGGLGRDRLLGGAGRDRLLGGAGLDALVGGPGRDLQAR